MTRVNFSQDRMKSLPEPLGMMQISYAYPTRLSTVQWSHVLAAPTIWNHLPTHIREITVPISFKNELKQSLLASQQLRLGNSD